MNKQSVKEWWDYIQSLLDIDGDLWMGLFTLLILIRIYYVLKGYRPLDASEAVVYGTAVSAFAYSNRTPKP